MGRKIYNNMLVPFHETVPNFLNFTWGLDLQEFKNQVSQCFGRATMASYLKIIPISCMAPKDAPKDTYDFSTHFGALEHVHVVQIWIMHIKCLENSVNV
jgi:hypothetical protein